MNENIEYSTKGVSNFRLNGFATGRYSCNCTICGNIFIGDKRATQCLKCAIEQSNQSARLEGIREAIEVIENNPCDADGYHACSQQEVYLDLLKQKLTEGK